MTVKSITTPAASIEFYENAPRTLAEQAQEIYDWAVIKGWEPDPDRRFAEEVALIHSEVSEALEAYRDHGTQAFVMVPDKILEGPSEDPENPNGRTFHIVSKKAQYVENQDYGVYKPEGVPSEFADTFIRLLHYSHVHGIDLQAEVDAKMAYNTTRPWRHGGRNL